MLKKILVALAVVIAGLLVLVSMQPATFHLVRDLASLKGLAEAKAKEAPAAEGMPVR